MQDNNEAQTHQWFGGFASLTVLFVVLAYMCF